MEQRGNVLEVVKEEAALRQESLIWLNVVLFVATVTQVLLFAHFNGNDERNSAVAMALFGIVCAFAPKTVADGFWEVHATPKEGYVTAENVKQRYVSKWASIGLLYVLPVLLWGGAAMFLSTMRSSVGGKLVFHRPERLLYCGLNWMILVAAVLFMLAIGMFCVLFVKARIHVVERSLFIALLCAIVVTLLPVLLLARLDNWAAIATRDETNLSGWGIFPVWMDFEGYVGSPAKSFLLLLVNCLISVGLIALLFRRYRKLMLVPATEDAKPKRDYLPGIVTCISVFICYCLIQRSYSLAGMILVALIEYVVCFLLVKYKKYTVKNILMWLGNFAVVTALFLVLEWAAFVTNGFGTVRTKPLQNLDNANILIEIGEDSFSRKLWYSGVDGMPYFSSKKQNKAAFLTKNETDDAQIREVLGIVQDTLAKRDRSFDRFLDNMNLNSYSIDEISADPGLMVTVTVYREDRYDPEVQHIILRQQARLEDAQREEMIAKLNALNRMQTGEGRPFKFFWKLDSDTTEKEDSQRK